MATLAFKLYTYVPTAPRFKKAISRCKPVLKPISIFNKLQRIILSSTKLGMPQSAVIDNCKSDNCEIRGKFWDWNIWLVIIITNLRHLRAGNDIITNYNENNNDFDLPSIKQLLYTMLQKESFAAENQPLNNATFKVGDRTLNKKGGSLDNNGSAPGSNLSGTLSEYALYLLSWKQISSFSNIA